jgi:two-component system LytT family response regulator
MKEKELIKTIIVEDDPISLKLLKEFLKRYDFISVVGEATTFADAQKVLKNQSEFDLLITDIDLQGANALDLIKYIKPNTQILFTTSFAEFAVKAFEYNTVDYILKPISMERLEKAMKRIKILGPDSNETFESNDDHHESKLAYDNMILMNINDEMRFIKVKDINYVQAKGNYANVGLIDGTEFTAYGLIKVWEDKLPAEHFIRIHRSTMVNLNNVQKIEKGTYDTGTLYLKGAKAPFEISRNYFSLLKNKFKLTSNLFS